MNKGVGIFALGSVILLLSAIGFLYFTTSEVSKIKNVTLNPGEVKNITYHLTPGTYVVVITSDKKVEYQITDANGTLIKKGVVKDKVEEKINTKSDVYYVISLKNSNEKNKVAILVEEENSLKKSQNTENTLFATCIIGIVLAVTGMAISFIRIKK